MQGCALRKVVRNLAHKNWKTGESNPSTSLHRSRDQRRPGGLRWAGGWQKNRAPRGAQGRQVKNCRSHVDRQRRHRPVLVGGVHRCGTWPASASATASAASLDAAPGQHRYRHRQEPSTRRMLWHGRRWRQRRRLPSMWRARFRFQRNHFAPKLRSLGIHPVVSLRGSPT